MSETLTVSETEVLTLSDGTLELLEVAMQGPPGSPGSGGGGGPNIYTYPADGSISGHKVVRVFQGKVLVCNVDDVMSQHSAIGISANAATNGNPVNIQASGEMTEPSWSWTEGYPIFMSANGGLTQTVPTYGFILIVAAVVSPTRIIIDIQQPLVLAIDGTPS